MQQRAISPNFMLVPKVCRYSVARLAAIPGLRLSSQRKSVHGASRERQDLGHLRTAPLGYA